jgi:TOD1/MUCI70, glycosyltransferase-like domain
MLTIYTAISAGYDRLPDAVPTPGVRWVAFIEDEHPTELAPAGPWEIRPLCRDFTDPNRNAKFHKVLSHLQFPDEEITIWIDGSVRILDPSRLPELVSRLGEADLGVFEHRTRTCVYQEAATCLAQKLDDPAVIWRTACEYTRNDVASNRGLWECSLLIRRNTQGVREFNQRWWQHIENGSRRDQLSFDRAVRDSAVRRIAIGGTIDENPYAFRVPHQLPIGRMGTWSGRISSGPPKTSLASRMKKIALGPIRPKTSWAWAGFDIGRELSKYYDVELFESMREPPAADVVLVVKHPLSLEFIERCRSPVVFGPIDTYASAEAITADAPMLRRCRAIVCHSPTLAPYLEAFAPVHRVEHHLRFALPEPVDFKSSGPVLWTGGFEHTPHLVSWLKAHPLNEELHILSNYRDARAAEVANARAAQLLGEPLDIVETPEGARLGPYRLRRFSERRQERLMAECRAAIDIKGDDFAQRTKPATKVQQFVASGIPTAVNPQSAPALWFQALGFELASPLDPDRWFSRAYFNETRAIARDLREALSLESVGRRYVDILESL